MYAVYTHIMPIIERIQCNSSFYAHNIDDAKGNLAVANNIADVSLNARDERLPSFFSIYMASATASHSLLHA